jgi:IclR family acetate operon transcriptional repressor
METEVVAIKTTQSSYIVASVDRALEIMLILGQSSHDVGVTELSRTLGVQKSTVHSLLQTLMARGFVDQNDNGRYTLGIKLMQLGNICAERLDVRKAANPIMTELAGETGEIVLLAVLSRNELIIIEKIEPQRSFLIIPKLDFTIAVHSTAVGKVLLANAEGNIVQAVVERGLRSYTPFTITDLNGLEDELDRVRSQGYAVGCNETIEGVTCIAVPVYNASGEVAAALSVSSASSAATPDRYGELIRLLKEKARHISDRLGYHPQ